VCDVYPRSTTCAITCDAIRMPYASRRERRGDVSWCVPPPAPGGRLGADQHVSSLRVGVKMLCVILLSTQSLSTRNKNGTDVVGVGTVVDCVVCVTNDIGTLVRSSSTTTVFASQAT